MPGTHAFAVPPGVSDEAAAALPPGYRVQFIGEAAELGKTERYVMFAFAVGTILLFMVLAISLTRFRVVRG